MQQFSSAVELLPKLLNSHVALLSACAATFVSYKVAKLWPVGKGCDRIPLRPIKSKGILPLLIGHLADELLVTFKDIFDPSRDEFCFDALQNVGRYQMLRRNYLVVANPHDIEYISQHSENYPKDPIYRSLFGRFLGEGLLSQTDIEKHTAHRRIIAPAFSPMALRHVANVVVAKHCNLLLQSLDAKAQPEGEEERPFEILPLLYDTTLGVMAEAIFKSSTMDSKEIGKVFQEGVDNAIFPARAIPFVDHFLVRQNRKVAKARAILGNLLQTLREEHDERQHGITGTNKSADGEGPVEAPPAVVDTLLSSEAFSESELLDHLITFMFAGNDTTKQTLHWFVYHLAKNQQVQEKLYEELCDAIGKGKACQVEDIAGCTYLSYCVKESLRVRSPAGSSARSPIEDDVLPGTKSFIPKGTILEVSSWIAMNQIPEYWGLNPREFNPERWENLPALGQKYRDIIWMPFYSGTRGCIGKDFAMNELLLISAVIFRNYRLALPVDEPEPLAVLEGAVCPKTPIRVLATPRTV